MDHLLDRTWNRLNAALKRLPPAVRRIGKLGPVAVVLLLVLVTAAVLGTIALQRQQAQAAASSLIIARADFHSETEYQGKDLEMNLVISQTGDDCQAALHGGFCLRYTVVLDEQAIMVGYGVIPAHDVEVTASSIAISVDTSKVPHFVHTVGQGGPIAVSWKFASLAGKSPSALINKPQKVSAQGGIATYSVPSSAVLATVIYQ
jgi:hypothetical protein